MKSTPSDRILFVCSANMNRSPTFEEWFKKNVDNPEIEFRSAGIYYGYPYQVDKNTLAWANAVFVMDLSHLKWIKENFPKFDDGRLNVVGISDQYDRDSSKLKELIEFWYNHIMGRCFESGQD